MTGDLYVQSVVENLPYGSPLRDQIAMELRSNIAERVAHGEPLEGVLQQLGDPLTLAESYLASIPAHGGFSVEAADGQDRRVLLVMCGFISYTVAAEYHLGRTLGKRMRGILVVLFTERKQRAFEILSKTRAVTA